MSAFGIDDPLPHISIPLGRLTLTDLDLGEPYNQAFEQSFYGIDIDYDQLPRRFLTFYDTSDQLKIVARLVVIRQQANAGKNIEDGCPFPIDSAISGKVEDRLMSNDFDDFDISNI